MDTIDRRLNSDERLMVMAKAITDHAMETVNAKTSGVSTDLRAYVDQRIEEAFNRLANLLMALPTVEIKVPPARLTRKDITYNDYGMPVKIVEKEAPASDGVVTER